MTRSAKKNRRVLHQQYDLYRLYLWPRVFVTVLNVKKNHQILQTQAQTQFYSRISSRDVPGVTLKSKDQVWQCVDLT